MATSAEKDLRRARELRAEAAKVKDPDARRAFEEAAARLERRAARKAKALGRTKPKSNRASSVQG